MFIEAKLNKSEGQTNIDKYSLVAHDIALHIINFKIFAKILCKNISLFKKLKNLICHAKYFYLFVEMLHLFIKPLSSKKLLFYKVIGQIQTY